MYGIQKRVLQTLRDGPRVQTLKRIEQYSSQSTRAAFAALRKLRDQGKVYCVRVDGTQPAFALVRGVTGEGPMNDLDIDHADKAALRAEVRRLQGLLAECCRLSGADPDGNEDWRISEHAVQEVKILRDEYDRHAGQIEALLKRCAKAEGL